jgi:predicted phage terminase large subunit-like protein
VSSTARLDGRAVVIGIPQDPGQAGKSQVAHYRRHVLRGFIVRSMPTSKNKETRAAAAAAAANNHLVGVARRHWTPHWVREVTGFPFTGHDDHLDSFADAHTLVSTAGPVRVSAARGRLPARRR